MRAAREIAAPDEKHQEEVQVMVTLADGETETDFFVLVINAHTAIRLVLFTQPRYLISAPIRMSKALDYPVSDNAD